MFKEKSKANDILRYAIGVSQGYHFNAPAGVRFSILIRLKQGLYDMGAVWQGKCLNYHIHRFQKNNKTDLQNPEGILTTNKRKKKASKKGGDVRVWYKNIP